MSEKHETGTNRSSDGGVKSTASDVLAASVEAAYLMGILLILWSLTAGGLLLTGDAMGSTLKLVLLMFGPFLIIAVVAVGLETASRHDQEVS